MNEKPGIPYGLTTEQLLALSHVPRLLRNCAEALQLYTPATEHAIQARYAAEWLSAAFPDVDEFWRKLEQEAVSEREAQLGC